MTTIGDRIRIRRSTGERGQTQYSLRGTEASRASEANQDIPEQEERQLEEAETKAEVVLQQETVHSRREANTIQHDPDRSSSRFSVRSIQNDPVTLGGAEAGIREDIPATGNNVVALFAAIERMDIVVHDELSPIIQEMEGVIGDIGRTTEG